LQPRAEAAENSLRLANTARGWDMMEQQLPEDTWLLPVLGFLALSSGLIWIWILMRRIQGQPIVRRMPRTPVPWSAAPAFLALLMALLALISLALPTATAQVDELSVDEMIDQIAHSMAIITIVTVVVVALVMMSSRADGRDLGLPESLAMLVRDGGLGFAAFLAALVPVYGMQALFVYGLGEPSEHPLIQMMLKEPNPVLLGAAVLSAVVVAPICEEIAFRLLLQGWLEKVCEARRWRHSAPPAVEEVPTSPYETHASTSATDEIAETRAPSVEPDGSLDSPIQNPVLAWLPVFVSSLLFALAHVGHGPDPVPLFVLALILGYVYRQTHRIVPSIVTHMLINGLSLAVLLNMILSQK
jgi:membrane protease YdiL (CAAX protease family)